MFRIDIIEAKEQFLIINFFFDLINGFGNAIGSVTVPNLTMEVLKIMLEGSGQPYGDKYE